MTIAEYLIQSEQDRLHRRPLRLYRVSVPSPRPFPNRLPSPSASRPAIAEDVETRRRFARHQADAEHDRVVRRLRSMR